MRKGRKKKNGSTFLDNQKRHRAEVKKSRFAKKVKKTDVEEGGEEDAGPRKAFKFQNFSEQVTSILIEFHMQKVIGDWCNFEILWLWSVWMQSIEALLNITKATIGDWWCNFNINIRWPQSTPPLSISWQVHHHLFNHTLPFEATLCN